MLEAFIDAPQRRRGLSIFPVTAAREPPQTFLLLAEALGSGALEVRKKGGESDPAFLARNHSLHAVLILKGEPILPEEEEQQQVADCSLLLPGRSVTVIPPNQMPLGPGEQTEGTGEMDSWLQAFPLLERQVGILAVSGRRVLGLEALGSPRLYAPHHERLVSRFLSEALAEEKREGETLVDWSDSLLKEDAAVLLKALEEAGRTQVEALGLGEYWALEGPVEGGELLYERQLVHVSAQPATAGPSPGAP